MVIKVLTFIIHPANVSHSYMVADKLSDMAEKLGVVMDIEIQGAMDIEIQGAMDIENHITEQKINRADIVVIVADRSIENSDRFVRKLCIKVSIREAMSKPEVIFSQCQQLMAVFNFLKRSSSLS